MPNVKPLCIRLPDDIHTAIVAAAKEIGVTSSEYVRDILYRAVYHEPLGIEQGYIEGRQIGFRTLQLVFGDCYEHMPPTVQEAVALVQENARRRRKPR